MHIIIPIEETSTCTYLSSSWIHIRSLRQTFHWDVCRWGAGAGIACCRWCLHVLGVACLLAPYSYASSIQTRLAISHVGIPWPYRHLYLNPWWWYPYLAHRWWATRSIARRAGRLSSGIYHWTLRPPCTPPTIHRHVELTTVRRSDGPRLSGNRSCVRADFDWCTHTTHSNENIIKFSLTMKMSKLFAFALKLCCYARHFNCTSDFPIDLKIFVCMYVHRKSDARMEISI